MNKSLHITATLDQPDLLENLVERLACRLYDVGYCNEKMPDHQEAFETSSTETYVSGAVALDDSGELINVPFITSFLFTCIKAKDNLYKLTWGSSLS